jgi:selenocysteine-specific elongation factor
MESHFIIATAGHVDHGKSALVKALTGTDPDRLPEEKRRQITIDLGFAELNLAGPDEQQFHIGIVDVPGHEDFVRNMIAGVGSIDLALLVVAADDGWMPQTEEHLQILSYLAVEHAAVAITKSDLGRTDTVIRQIRDRLRDSPFAKAQIIATSIRNRDGIEDLKSALAKEFASMRPPRDYGKPRLFIDRVFTLRGIGTVVTGTLTGGQVHREQKIVVQPGNLEARIRSIQSHGRELEVAEPGMRTAINLPDIRIEQISRGDVITSADMGGASSTLIAFLEKSSRLGRENPAARPMKNGSSVYLHHGTSRVAAKIAFPESGTLEPGQKKIVHLKLAAPIFAFAGDRLVIRDPSERHTIAGGMVLDPAGDKAKVGGASERELIAARGRAPDDVDLYVRSEVALGGFAEQQTLLGKSHFSADEISEALMRLQRADKIILHEGITADRELWTQLRAQAISLIDETHKRNPERAGLDLNELSRKLTGASPSGGGLSGLRQQTPDVFEALVDDLCAGEFVRVGSAIARAAHRPSLPEELEAIAREIREALSQKPFDPPSRREIDSDLRSRQVLRFLIEAEDVIEIRTDVVLLRESLERMKLRIADFISKNGPATVGELRQALGSSRRIMVPLLEKLDREGFTWRVGDKRTLR